MTEVRRRNWRIAGIAALVAAVAVAAVVALTRDEADKQDAVDPATPSPVAELADGFRWLGYRAVEVQVPDDWPLDFSPTRPDCAELGSVYRGPEGPYVEIDPGQLASVDIGCSPPDLPADLPAEFGALPVEYWQPHVTLADPLEDRPDGSWSYRGWTLTRSTSEDVQVAVLAPPNEPDLADDVIGSAHPVEIDSNGCATTSSVQAGGYPRPTAAPVPDPTDVAAVSVCQYARGDVDRPGLVGSRRIVGEEAHALTRAIVTAPEGTGPDNPNNCMPDDYGDFAIVLRFLATAEVSSDDAPEAYVYSTSCRGNGIVDRDRRWQLTKDDCLPLYEAPVHLWLSHQGVARVCLPPRS